MSKLMDINGKLFQVMGRIGDLIVLNLLLLACSLPVVTIGAAITAVYDMSLRLLRGDEGHLIRGYFKAFRSNFKEATKLWLVCVAVITVIAGDLLVRSYLPQFAPLLTIAAGIQGVVLLAAALYAFPLQARYENSIGRTLYNSVVLAIYNLPETVIMVLISLSAVLVFLFIPLPEWLIAPFLTLCVLLWLAGAIYLNAGFVSKIFQKHFHSEQSVAKDEGE